MYKSGLEKPPSPFKYRESLFKWWTRGVFLLLLLFFVLRIRFIVPKWSSHLQVGNDPPPKPACPWGNALNIRKQCPEIIQWSCFYNDFLKSLPHAARVWALNGVPWGTRRTLWRTLTSLYFPTLPAMWLCRIGAGATRGRGKLWAPLKESTSTFPSAGISPPTSKSIGWNIFLMMTTRSWRIRDGPARLSGLQSNCLMW